MPVSEQTKGIRVQNAMRTRLLAGLPSLGVVSTIPSPTAAALLARAGCDHVLIDCQHGEWDEARRVDAIRAVALQGSTPVVRVVANGYAPIGRALDAGALGIVVPMVNRAEEAQAAAYALRYPPRGGRSSADPLALHYGTLYGTWANDEAFLAVQIETAEALENVDAILAVDGVDGCWLGPADLALSLGTAIGSAAHDEALRRVAEACRRAGKVAGMFVGTAAGARRWLAEGYRFVTVGAELRWLEAAVQGVLADVRAGAPEGTP